MSMLKKVAFIAVVVLGVMVALNYVTVPFVNDKKVA